MVNYEFLNKALKLDFELEEIRAARRNHRETKTEEKEKQEALRLEILSAVANLVRQKQSHEEMIPKLMAVQHLFPEFADACPALAPLPNQESSGTPFEGFQEKMQDLASKVIIDKASKLLERARSGKGLIFASRNKLLERALQILLKLEDLSPGSRAASLVAECYCERSLNILPQGTTIPPRKMEALQKALAATDQACPEILNHLRRLEPANFQEQFQDALEDLFVSGSFTAPKTVQDYVLLDQYCEAQPDEAAGLIPLLQQAVKAADLQGSADKDLHPENLFLITAKACLRLCRLKKIQEPEVAAAFDNCLGRMKKFGLFHHCWDDLISFLQENLPEPVVCAATIGQATIKAWEICHSKQRKMSCGIHLRQYWSRLQGLYELAFQVAVDRQQYSQAARIADSLKGRSSMVWKNVLAVLAEKPNLNAEVYRQASEYFFNIEAQAYADNFTVGGKDFKKNFPDLTPELLARGLDTPMDINDLPLGWSAVHLHLSDHGLDGLHGSAIIISNRAADRQISSFQKTIPTEALQSLWQAYVHWSEVCGGVKKGKNSLVDLCEKIGRALDFVFDLVDDKQKIIWLPHGFTHKLPLHAACNPKDGTYLFEKTASVYLPTWPVLPKSKANQPMGAYCFRAFPENQNNYFANIAELPWDVMEPKTNKECFRQFAETTNTAPPRYLALLCHGKADPNNPFAAHLQLNNSDLTFLELNCLDLKLTGSQVFLGACETELTPPHPSQVDEHLSMAGAFLAKGASQVVGTLWELDEALAEPLLQDCMQEDQPLWQLVWHKQQEWWENGLPGAVVANVSKESKLHCIAPIRVLGYPVPLPSQSAKKSEE